MDKKDLPANFRHIRLELAREHGHPEGDSAHGYDILAPLTDDGHIDERTARANKFACRVRRFRPHEEDAVGLLVHRRGNWMFDYDKLDDADDEPGFHFEDETFVTGEYVSLREDDGDMHTFRVMQVEEV